MGARALCNLKGAAAVHWSREITERTRAPSGVAAFMSAHSKTPYITPSMDFSSGKGVVRGRTGQQLGFALLVLVMAGTAWHRSPFSTASTAWHRSPFSTASTA